MPIKSIETFLIIGNNENEGNKEMNELNQTFKVTLPVAFVYSLWLVCCNSIVSVCLSVTFLNTTHACVLCTYKYYKWGINWDSRNEIKEICVYNENEMVMKTSLISFTFEDNLWD